MGATGIDFPGIAHMKVGVIALQKMQVRLMGKILSEMLTSACLIFTFTRIFKVTDNSTFMNLHVVYKEDVIRLSFWDMEPRFC